MLQTLCVALAGHKIRHRVLFDPEPTIMIFGVIKKKGEIKLNMGK